MIDDKLLQNKYSMVKGAARRARQLQSGAPPLGVSNSLKACRVAEDEVRAGKVTYSVSAKKPSTASRVRVWLLGSRCVYTRSVKPGSWWPRYSASSLMDTPPANITEA